MGHYGTLSEEIEFRGNMEELGTLHNEMKQHYNNVKAVLST